MAYAFFFVLAAALTAAALGVVLLRSPVRGALSLVAVLGLLAVMFLSLHAPLLAALQVIVYAGAIMVLFLFVIMLLNLSAEPREPGRRLFRTAAALTGGGFVTAMGLSLAAAAAWRGPGMGVVPHIEFGSVVAVSRRLFTSFAVPFELTSLLLLVAIVGAVVLAKRHWR